MLFAECNNAEGLTGKGIIHNANRHLSRAFSNDVIWTPGVALNPGSALALTHDDMSCRPNLIKPNSCDGGEN